MRRGRLVAIGLVLGVAAGFLGALLRPRLVPSYDQRPSDAAAPDELPAPISKADL